jgi:hypothetical protein
MNTPPSENVSPPPVSENESPLMNTVASNSSSYNDANSFENMNSPVINSENSMNQPTTTRTKQIRSEKQKEADAGQAKMLERLRNMYDEEFSDVPLKSRPKAKAWVARAAYYKPTEEERENYISKMMKADRDALHTGKTINSSNIESMGKGSVKSMVNELRGSIDSAVERATINVQASATTPQTRKAARNFIKTLRSSTQKLKSSLMKHIGNSGNNNSNNDITPANVAANVNENLSLNVPSPEPVVENSEPNLNFSGMNLSSPESNSTANNVTSRVKRYRSNNSNDSLTDNNSLYKRRKTKKLKTPLSNSYEL